MKWKQLRREVLVPHERDGRTHMVTDTVTERVPVLPRDLDVLALRAVAGLVLVVTLVTVAWSTVSIGTLLGGGVGFAAAALFDVAWAAVLILEWLARFDPAKRRFARVVGWLLVGITMGALVWEGVAAGSMALALVGAAVSLIAKVLWLAVFRHIDRDLSPADAQWVQAEMSRANAMLAVAGVRRQVARAEANAAMELLAAERERQAVGAVTGAAGPEPVPAVAEPVLVAPERRVLAAEPVTDAEDVDERLREALALWQAVQSTPDLPEADRVWAAGRVADAAAGAGVPVAAFAPTGPTAARREPVARPAAVPVQVNETSEDVDRHAGPEVGRVPAQAPASLAAGVRELRAARITDPAVMAARLSALMDRPVEIPSVKREIRRIEKAEREAAEAAAAEQPQGLYL